MTKALLVALNIALLVSGQTLWKYGVQTLTLRGFGSLLSALVTPWIALGIFLYAVATVVWIYLLKQLPLSLLYPLQSLAYVAAVCVGMWVFHEPVPWTRWLGLAVILAGVVLVAR